MKWEQVVEFYPAARAMAKTWSYKVGRPDEWEDLAQDLMIALVSVDLNRVEKGSVDNYIAGVLWKRSHSYFLSGKNKRFFDLLPLAYNMDGEIITDSHAEFGKSYVTLWRDEEDSG